MESPENNNKRAFQCFYQRSLSISDYYLQSPFPKQSFTTYISLGGSLTGVEKIKFKPLLGRPKDGSSRLIEVVG